MAQRLYHTDRVGEVMGIQDRCRSARLSNKSERTLYLEFPTAGGADALVRRRPPGRPSHARPSILLSFPHQPGTHRIHLNIVPYLLEFPIVPRQVVIALFLPKGIAGQSQHRVGPFGP